MNYKTKINAAPGQQDLLISREFELPRAMLFRAFTEPTLLHEWMGTNVLKLENHAAGSYSFETKDLQGAVVFKAKGVIHEWIADQKIIRTFEMENAGLPVQLEFLEFAEVTPDTSRLEMHIIYRSVWDRDQVLKMPFEYGINRAHDRLQEVMATKS
jgi:uncharacterized protein YndB with AHSA1/START domain